MNRPRPKRARARAVEPRRGAWLSPRDARDFAEVATMFAGNGVLIASMREAGYLCDGLDRRLPAFGATHGYLLQAGKAADGTFEVTVLVPAHVTKFRAARSRMGEGVALGDAVDILMISEHTMSILPLTAEMARLHEWAEREADEA